MNRRDIASGPADTEKEGSQGRLKRVSSRALRDCPTTKASRPNTPPKMSGRKQKKSTAWSISQPSRTGEKFSRRRAKRQSSH